MSDEERRRRSAQGREALRQAGNPAADLPSAPQGAEERLKKLQVPPEVVEAARARFEEAGWTVDWQARGTAVFSLRLPDELADTLVAVASSRGVTPQAVLTGLVRQLHAETHVATWTWVGSDEVEGYWRRRSVSGTWCVARHHGGWWLWPEGESSSKQWLDATGDMLDATAEADRVIAASEERRG